MYNTCRHEFYIPNAFNPNSNRAENKIFKPHARHVNSYKFSIYNRWGELLYVGTESDAGWDGNYRDQPAPDGMYLYQVSYQYTENKLLKTMNSNGLVSLMR